METTVQVAGVYDKTINGKQVWDVVASDKTRFTIWEDEELANLAKTAKDSGKQLRVTYNESQKGNFTNRTVKGLSVGEAVNGNTPAATRTTPSPIPQSKDAEIRRAVALKAAVELRNSGFSLEDVVTVANIADDLLLWLEGGYKVTDDDTPEFGESNDNG